MSTLKYPPGSSEAQAQGCICSSRSIGMARVRCTASLVSTFILDAPSTGWRRSSRPANEASFRCLGARDMMTKTSQPGAEPANVFEMAIFSGPRAHERAIMFAERCYGSYEQVRTDR